LNLGVTALSAQQHQQAGTDLAHKFANHFDPRVAHTLQQGHHALPFLRLLVLPTGTGACRIIFRVVGSLHYLSE
jgi:hypothetical protein